MKRLHLKVHGQVHDVCYRANTQEKAKQIGLFGWVRNLADGTVEILAEGEEQSLKELLAWCYQGPKHATVANIEEVWEDVEKIEFNSFEIKYAV